MSDIMKLGDQPRFLGSWDILNGDIIATIDDFREETIEGNRGVKERKCILYFKEKEYLPMVCNLTNRKTLAKLFKTVNSDKLNGKRISIGTEQVRAFGKMHDALRIRPIVPAQTAPAKAAEIKCEQCGQPITAAYNMQPDKLAQYTLQKFGKRICAACAEKAAKDGAE